MLGIADGLTTRVVPTPTPVDKRGEVVVVLCTVGLPPEDGGTGGGGGGLCGVDPTPTLVGVGEGLREVVPTPTPVVDARGEEEVPCVVPTPTVVLTVVGGEAIKSKVALRNSLGS